MAYVVDNSGKLYMDNLGNAIVIPDNILPTPSITPTFSITPTVTATASITPTPTLTPFRTATITPSITITPTATITATLTPSHTPTITPTHSPTLTPTMTPGGGPTQIFNYASGFTSAVSSGAITLASSQAALVGSAIDVAYTTTGHAASAMWYTSQVNVSSGFMTTFTFKVGPITTGGTTNTPSSPGIAGFSFVVQNTNSSTDPGNYGIHSFGDANMSGYGGYNLTSDTLLPIYNSIGVKFDSSGINGVQIQYPPSAAALASTGLYANGGTMGALVPDQDMTAAGINLYGGNLFTATITYDNTTLTLVLKDTVTNAQYRTSWAVNIPSCTGSNTNWVGLAGGVGPGCIGQQRIQTWNFYQGYYSRLATPTITPTTGQYSSSQSVTISGPSGSTIYYTTNGNSPSTSSTVYGGSFTVSADTIVQAIAVQSSYTDSFVATSYIQIRASSTPTINISNFSTASNLIVCNGSAVISGTTLRLTDTTNGYPGEAGAAWFATPVIISSFHTYFNLHFTGSGLANGMTFCIQNPNGASGSGLNQWASGGPNALGNNSGGLGYSGITNAGSGGTGPSGIIGQQSGLLNSIMVKFDLYTGGGNLTGLYTNAAIPYPGGISITGGVNITNGNIVAVELYYDGTTLYLTMTDTVTSNVFNYNWTVNIPSIVGAATAYVGFTGSTGGIQAQQVVTSWTFGT